MEKPRVFVDPCLKTKKPYVLQSFWTLAEKQKTTNESQDKTPRAAPKVLDVFDLW